MDYQTSLHEALKQRLLEAEGPLVSFDFDIEHPISPEEMRALEDRARKSLLDGLVSDWVYSIFPKE